MECQGGAPESTLTLHTLPCMRAGVLSSPGNPSRCPPAYSGHRPCLIEHSQPLGTVVPAPGRGWVGVLGPGPQPHGPLTHSPVPQDARGKARRGPG